MTNIPKSFKIGTKKYTVERVPPKRTYRGLYMFSQRHIYVTEQPPDKEMETFWHEATHAILHAMDHPLRRNEKFVESFSSKLAQLIRTARF